VIHETRTPIAKPRTFVLVDATYSNDDNVRLKLTPALVALTVMNMFFSLQSASVAFGIPAKKTVKVQSTILSNLFTGQSR
jgi:hypothetical protein